MPTIHKYPDVYAMKLGTVPGDVDGGQKLLRQAQSDASLNRMAVIAANTKAAEREYQQQRLRQAPH